MQEMGIQGHDIVEYHPYWFKVLHFEKLGLRYTYLHFKSVSFKNIKQKVGSVHFHSLNKKENISRQNTKITLINQQTNILCKILMFMIN